METIKKYIFLIVITGYQLPIHSAANQALAQQFARASRSAHPSVASAVHTSTPQANIPAATPHLTSSTTATETATPVPQRPEIPILLNFLLRSSNFEEPVRTVAGASMAAIASVAEVPDHDLEDPAQATARKIVQHTKKEIAHDQMLASTQEFHDIFTQIQSFQASTRLLPTLAHIVSLYAVPSPWLTHTIQSMHSNKGHTVTCSKAGVLAIKSCYGSMMFLHPDGTHATWHINSASHWVDPGAWSPDGKIFAAGLSTGSVVFLNPDGTERHTWTDTTKRIANSLAWSPNGSICTVLVSDGSIVFLRSNGTTIKEFHGPPETQALSLNWAPNGPVLAAGLSRKRSNGGVMFLKPNVTQRTTWKRTTWTGNSATWILSASWAPNGTFFAIVLNKGNIMFLRPANTSQRVHSVTDKAVCVAWAPDSTILAVGLRNRTIAFLRPDHTVRNTSLDLGAQIKSLAWAPDGSLCAVRLSNGNVVLLQSDGTVCNTWHGVVETQIESLTWTPDGNALLVALNNQTIHILQPSTQLLHPIQSTTQTGSALDPAPTNTGTTSSTTTLPRIVRGDQSSLAYAPTLDDEEGCDNDLDVSPDGARHNHHTTTHPLATPTVAAGNAAKEAAAIIPTNAMIHRAIEMSPPSASRPAVVRPSAWADAVRTAALRQFDPAVFTSTHRSIRDPRNKI